MSLVDLCNILNTGPPALLLNDFNICARTVEALLKLLDDTNGDVQSQALKRYIDQDGLRQVKANYLLLQSRSSCSEGTSRISSSICGEAE